MDHDLVREGGVREKRTVSVVLLPVFSELREQFQALGIIPTTESVAIFPEGMCSIPRDSAGLYFTIDLRNLFSEQKNRGLHLTDIHITKMKSANPNPRWPFTYKLALVFEREATTPSAVVQNALVWRAVKEILDAPVRGFQVFLNRFPDQNLEIECLTVKEIFASGSGFAERVIQHDDGTWITRKRCSPTFENARATA